MKRWSICACAVLTCALTAGVSVAETWRGLVVVPECRCSPYDKKKDYGYSQKLERKIVKRLGSVYGPYTKRCFASERETDIEHIVATSEAHDSGLCSRSREERLRFASDLRNLTLASPSVNRYQKSDKDAADWLPPKNQCWFVNRVVEVRQAYGLTIDRREKEALERVLSKCESMRMEPVKCGSKADAGR
ncbi:MAG: HNH endonuclease family protein [Nitrospinae bacterium]|nr:HNH endonuclease family protein [Nitrospinota bacterium]